MIMEAPEYQRESTIKDFLDVVFRRKWIILGIVVVATTVVVFLNMREPAIYESSAKILVKRGETPSVFSTNVRTLTWEEEIASQIELVESQVVIDRAQENLPKFFPAGYTSSEKIKQGNVNAGVISKSNVIWVTYTSDDPVFCEAAVSAIVNAYRDYYQKIRTPPEMEDFFSEELQSTKEEIEFWRSEKEKVLKQWNIIDLKNQRVNLINMLSNYQKDLDDVVKERAEKEIIISRLEKMRSGNIDTVLAGLSGLNASSIEDKVVKDLRAKLQELKMKESELKAKYTDKYPELIKVRKQIGDVIALIDNELDTQILVIKNQLDVVKRKEATISGIISRLENERSHYPSQEVELERIDDALARLQKNYNELVAQRMSARVSLASNPEWTVTILTPATKAYRKKTRDYVRIALGPIFSIIVALGFAFFMDNLDHSIKNIAEAESLLNLPVFSSIPDKDVK
ncbi:hypothetical protein DRQ05_02655 [bacterium]|nr:MAG: hypothetical protein DRQ05_02655 [bacterium]